MIINEILSIVSEVVLSAYPLLIKLVDASIPMQTGLRMISYTILASIAAIVTKSPIAPTSIFSPETIFVGLMNLLHVGASYTAFDQLAGGNAMALFYTYPIWNILGSAYLFKEKIQKASVPWIGLALLGAVLLSQPSLKNWTALGVVAALVAAITETGIYLWFRTHKESESDQPWTKMIQMYGSSSVFWSIGILCMMLLGSIAKNTFKVSPVGLATILAFNTFIGFVGYALRFYLIPKVSTIVFSALSFIGVFAAYGLGWLFTNEIPNFTQILGAIAIIVANTVLLRRETV